MIVESASAPLPGVEQFALTIANREDRPSRAAVLQFGEGNFLRAFVDWMIDVANEKLGLNVGVRVVQPIERGMVDALSAQDNLFTVLLRGKQNGRVVKEARIVRSVIGAVNPYEDFDAFLSEARNNDLMIVVSNTTEAGIAYTGNDRFDDRPPASFPGKVTRLLYERWSAGLPGLVFAPCELIDANGDALRECVLKTAAQWSLEPAFQLWLVEENEYLNTLVDRIVTGYPRQEAEELWTELGYRDNLLDVAEPFGLWVIQSSDRFERALPLHKAGLPVIFAPDVDPYKKRKVRLLNGAHTAMVHAGYLCGLDTVGECMGDPMIRRFMALALENEIMPYLPLDQDDVRAFAEAVVERFENPFNRHLILSITLNSISKFRARVLPSIDIYIEKNGVPPPALAFSMASLLAFYLNGEREKDGAYPLVDDAPALACFEKARGGAPRDAARALLAESPACDILWGGSLARLQGFIDAVANDLERIDRLGMRAALECLTRADPI
ncbi:MAG: tagaturonate reductase [Oscillospiraceae bacterium]|nr:tagaturonate reductase [Oscillospiraceae bacterium]